LRTEQGLGKLRAADTGKAAPRAFSCFPITQRDPVHRRSPMPTVDSVGRDWWRLPSGEVPADAPSERPGRRSL